MRLHHFLSTLTRRQVLENGAVAAVRLKSISVERDAFGQEQLLEALLLIVEKPAPSGVVGCEGPSGRPAIDLQPAARAAQVLQSNWVIVGIVWMISYLERGAENRAVAQIEIRPNWPGARDERNDAAVARDDGLEGPEPSIYPSDRALAVLT
jgi:hypothetical protein